jgi:hypothetical protein
MRIDRRSAAPDVGRGGARTHFPINRRSLVSGEGSRVNHHPMISSVKVTHRFDTPFLRGEDPSPAAEDLKRIRGRRLAGEPASGWGRLGVRS